MNRHGGLRLFFQSDQPVSGWPIDPGAGQRPGNPPEPVPPVPGTGKATGTDFQAALAQAWGQLQVLFEDDALDTVYFVNPLDIADYLAEAAISTQTAFGMTYVEDFLGLGTVIMNASVPKGKIYATAKENIVLYYIPVNGADLGEAFDFTSDETGYIGIHETPDYTNMTASDTVVNGMTFLADRIDGVVVATIGAGA